MKKFRGFSIGEKVSFNGLTGKIVDYCGDRDYPLRAYFKETGFLSFTLYGASDMHRPLNSRLVSLEKPQIIKVRR